MKVKIKTGSYFVSVPKGKDNGLTNAWLSSSLEISSVEQVQFLQKLIDNQLPASIKVHEMTKKILFVEDLQGGWKLYGKTSNGPQLSEDKTKKLDRQAGWFVGWIEKDERIIPFSYLVVDDDKQETYASLRAKERARNNFRV